MSKALPPELYRWPRGTLTTHQQSPDVLVTPGIGAMTTPSAPDLAPTPGAQPHELE